MSSQMQFSTVQTPIKSVDESLTVTERMTDNTVDGILPARYLIQDEKGEITETVSDLFERVAKNVAGAEETEPEQEHWAELFEHQMKTLRLMPNSPTLMNSGTDMNQLSACFVLEPKDDMGDIFQKAKEAALIFQSGGGVGYAFSHLRPQGAYIASTGGEASGPVSFMKVFDETCNQVKQGGKRRGAQMGILRVDHPDIGRFAVSKRNEGDLSNFNISVGYTDEFVEAVQNGESYTLYDPETDYEEPYVVREESAQFYNVEFEDNPVDAYDDGEGVPVSGNIWRDHADEITTVNGMSLYEKWAGEIDLTVGEEMELPAEFLWDVMIDGAHKNGEPGLFYLDETNREHSFDTGVYAKHKINATNPCAEQPLSENEACNLMHINLSLVVEDGSESYENGGTQSVEEYFNEVIDFENLNQSIRVGTRFLDNVVTQSNFPTEKIERRVDGQRKIGLGIMGFAQMLYQMGIAYGSEESYEVARCIMRYIDREATLVSHQLAKERSPFQYWEESKYADPMEYCNWFERHTGLQAKNYQDGFKIRNHNVTTIAPTGTTSMIANTSGGCEPVYNVANFKNVGNDIQGDDVLVEFDDYFLKTLEANDLDVDAIKEQAETLMRNDEFEGIEDLDVPERLKDIFVTTQDLSSRQHGLMQRAFQEFCDSGISKTINMPNDATRRDVANAYQLAFKENEIGAPIKGLTVYRDGSRNEQVLTTRMENNLEDDDSHEKVRELYLSDEVSDRAARELGLNIEEGGDVPCPQEECDGTLKPTDDCSICDQCFYSPCN